MDRRGRSTPVASAGPPLTPATDVRTSWRRIAATAVLVGVGYYLGAKVGEYLRLLPVTTSVMWPPNAILTATLLLTAPRRWWIYLLVALPAHLSALPDARPTPLGLLLFVTNCSEALLAAISVRALSDRVTAFDTLRRVSAFIVGAVFFAPFASSFADAAVVSWVHGEPYWLVWRVRLFANMLTELALVPTIVVTVTLGLDWIRTASPLRRLEAALLTLAPAVAWMVLQMVIESSKGLRGYPGVPLVLLLPSLVWAALRFGPGATSLSLLTNTLLAIISGALGAGPLTPTPDGEDVLALQIFLTAQGVPLLGLAGVIAERRRVQLEQGERLRFEELLSRLSGAFVHLPEHAIEAASETWLRHLGDLLQVDRITVYRRSGDHGEFVADYSWHGPAFPPPSPVLVGQDLPWTAFELRSERPVAFSRVDDLPPEAASDAEAFRNRGVRSGLWLPLVAGGQLIGSLSVATLVSERPWPDEAIQRLQLVAEVFASAIARKEAEAALRASEAMNSAILATLNSGVAVLDQSGRIVSANQRWTRFVEDWGVFGVPLRAETSYLKACWDAAVDGVVAARDAVSGIEAVLRRTRGTFVLEYSLGTEAVSRWFTLTVLPLKSSEGGAVISQTDITERKRAEIDAQRSREELAHFTRVSTMGELATSLAHELNQPLTAILANAQAAQRFLDRTPPDLDEIRPILADIVDDDKRAGEVIQRLREFLRKGLAEVARLDLNMVIRDVVRLLASDALIRNVEVTLDLSPQQPAVNGDRVHLQQLVLNLVLNALEAMAEVGDDNRIVAVRTRVVAGATVDLAVEDAGPGLRPGAEKLVFEPFYTTKPAGMGMGLSIARSIATAHGGMIYAVNNRTRGATFHVSLPLVEAKPA
jgi:signal transduction histidine kinase/integral membrane sensor domain MASE1